MTPSRISPGLSTSRKHFPVLFSTALFSLVVLSLWQFPGVWYSSRKIPDDFAWLRERAEIADWHFRPVPVGQAAEALLVADRILSGEFVRGDGAKVRVFSAKRHSARANQIGLFAHTPDRCWASAGWRLDRVPPDFIECRVQDISLVLERRVFFQNNERELVLFGGLVGGKPIPYRLDQYFSASLRKGANPGNDFQSGVDRIGHGRLWGWAWNAFAARTPFGGPQHFLRVSTPILGGDVDAADKLLTEFIPKWLLRTH